MRKLRYRVNLHIYYRKPDDGSLITEPFHVGFWDDEQMARAVIAGLDLRFMAFHYARRSLAGLTPMGRVHAVVGSLVVNASGTTVENGPDIVVREATYTPPRETVAA